MPITEFVTLKINDPTINILEHTQLRKTFAQAAVSNEEYSGYPLTFYIDLEDPSVFYLLTGWVDVETHMKWIRGETNQEIMKQLQPYISVLGVAHLDIDFGGVPKDTKFIVYSRSKIVEGGGEGQAPEGHGEGFLWAAAGQDYEKEGDCCRLAAYATLPTLKNDNNTGHLAAKVICRFQVTD